METEQPTAGLELRSLLTDSGVMEQSLVEVVHPARKACSLR
jgi:hypothetical protein